MQPDLTRITTVQPPPPDIPNNNHMNMFDELPAYAEVKDCRHSSHMVAGNGVPNSKVIVEPNLNYSDNNSGDRVSVRNDRNLPKNTVIVSPYACSEAGLHTSETDNLRDSQNSLVSNEAPSHIDTDAVTWNKFDHRGGRLTLPESGVSLLIPEGAIRHGQTEEIYMAVCRDDKDRPRLSGTCLFPLLLKVKFTIQLIFYLILKKWKHSLCYCSSVTFDCLQSSR